MFSKEKRRLPRFFPRSRVSRFLDSGFVVLAGLASLFEYYLIEFELCTADACSALTITKFWYDASFSYLLYGVCVLGVGAFLWAEKDLARINAGIITVSIAVSTVLNGMIVFAISKELVAG